MKIDCAGIVRIAACACAALVLTGAVLKSSVARAAWPDHTITIIVPFPPGGPNDLLGRLLAAELAPKLGQNVIVENRAGAVGNIGLAAGARAAPDGHTLVVVTGVVLINPSVTKVAYDPIKDFAPIAYLGAAPNAIITRPASGITSIADLIAKAKANPGKITYATAGLGSVSQLTVELLKLRAGIDMTHVPYSGAAPSLQASLQGTTDVASVSIAGLIGHISSGTLKALAQTGAEHWVDLPDVPTLQEAGVPNAVVETSQMFLAPAGTPPDIVAKLNDAMAKVLKTDAVKAKLANLGLVVQAGTPAELAEIVKDGLRVRGELVKAAGIQPE